MLFEECLSAMAFAFSSPNLMASSRGVGATMARSSIIGASHVRVLNSFWRSALRYLLDEARISFFCIVCSLIL